MNRILAMIIVLAAMTLGTTTLLAGDGCGCGCDKAKEAKSACGCDHQKGEMKDGKSCPHHAQEAVKAEKKGAAKPDAKAEVKAEANVGKWVCPMAEEFVSDKPGKCPKCGMNLVKKEKKK